jgi:hypothetical protein
MKTKKIITGMMLVVLALTTSLQLYANENLSIQEKKTETTLFDENLSDHLMVEPWMYDLEYWPELKVEIEQVTELEEEVVEEDLFLEPWMSRVL